MSLKKIAKVESPHAIYVDARSGFEYRVLKAYKSPAGEAKDPYARWFLGTKSPYTFGSFELGDGYVQDVKPGARLVAATTEFLAAYFPSDAVHLRAKIATPEEYIAAQKVAA